MAQTQYDVVYDGAILDGCEAAEVQVRLAGLFKTTVEKIQPLFSGKPVVIKRGLDPDSARRYQAAMEKAGARCRLVEAPGAQVETGVPAASQTLAAGLAPAGSPLTTQAPVPEPAIDTSAFSMAPVGADVTEPTTTEPPHIDTDGISLAAAGADLTESAPAAAPEFNLSGFSLAPAGADVADASEPPAPPPPAGEHLRLEP